jgi:exodeoxyribonuclease V gamma subunit
MALNLNVSNSLSQLALKLSKDLQQQQGNVFQPQYIVTQTEGMNNWLKLQIATHNGIAANCVFLTPNDVILRAYFFLGGKHPNMLSPQNLTWLLYRILGEQIFNRRFPAIAAYYNNDGFDRDLKRLALAEKTADLFDQYQIYRPDWIEDWNSSSTEQLSGEKWQEYLWLRSKELLQERLPDKTVVGRYIREALKDEESRKKLQGKIPALNIFGLSITTDFHLGLLFEISNCIDISFHILNPAPPVYWFEDRSEKQLAILMRKGLVDKNENNAGNTLLTSWGRVIQDTFVLLFKNEELLNSFNDVGVVEPETDTLLHKLQNDIFNSAVKQDRNALTLADVKDNSITISSCYTVAREVEVLYNYFVHLVDQKKEALSPRDIVVMVTDIDSYAPYIKAVFKNAPYKFHFTIADESYSNGDTMVAALTAILKMNRQNFKAEEVLQLLDSGFIRKRFSISNLDLVRRVVSAANIRFGMQGNKKDDTVYVSWEYGIKRIMYGICMSGAEEYADNNNDTLFPLDLTEGSESLEVIRFCHFVQVLIDSINERERDRTITEWVDYTERLIRNMVCEPEEEIDEDYIMLQEELKNFNVANDFIDEKIDFNIFTHSLLQSVSGAGRAGSFAGGGITFCSLIPMRSIPFKVVALLGLNFDKFPRKESAASFNLMEKDRRRRGDRNVKENDKHLFLETILSAREYLYLSYIGQSAKDNTPLPPSAMVDELIDYITEGCDEPEKVRPVLVIKHPLHSFSERYNDALPGYYNYLDTKPMLAVKTSDENKVIEPFGFEEISLEGLISFFKNPFKAYYNKVLDIYYEDEDVLLGDTEVFKLDTLQAWSIKPQLVSMDEDEIEVLKKRLVKTGGLPLKNMATVTVDELEEDISKVRELFKECVGGEMEETVTIELAIDNSLLKGNIRNIYGNKLVFVSYSKNENKYLLEAYIRYLVARAFGLEHEVYFISANKEAIYEGTVISKSQAINRLTDLLQLYKTGHEKIITFYPGFKIKPADVDILEEALLQKLVNDVLHNYQYPCDDQYLINEYRNGYFKSVDLVEQFKENGEKLIKPLAELFPGYYEK